MECFGLFNHSAGTKQLVSTWGASDWPVLHACLLVRRCVLVSRLWSYWVESSTSRNLKKGEETARWTGTKPHPCSHFLCCDQLVLRLYPHGRGFSLISSTSARLIYLPNPDKTTVVSLVYFCGSVVSISWTSYRPVGSLNMCCNSLKFGLQFN